MKKDNNGLCILAGAGPGDVGLVTLRTREALEQAEVVVYDYLCNPDILTWVPVNAEIVFAGKKSGNHTLPQEEINRLLVEKTKQGKRVVRLKAGDPFVFGRGGEEAEALAQAGLAFEIVPGVSSAIAVPAYAGIPLTHRDFASSFTIFTGHEDPAKVDTATDYRPLVAGDGTLVMLMGMERLASIVQKLLANGADRDLPVALIRWGTTGLQQTLTGTLESIVNASLGFHPPAVAVFGRVVELRAKLKWFERRPLFGLRIVVTRARKQASGLSAKLRMLGAEVCELPTIRVEPPENLTEFGELVRHAGQYDWLLFTSVNGVDSFFEIFYRLYTDARRIGNVKIAAIGPATAQRIKRYHLAVDFQPKAFIAEAIVDGLLQFGSVENLKFLVVRALGAREVLPKRLTELGAIVDEAIAYRTVPETNDTSGALERFKATGADVVTFTSSSTVENFLALKLPWPAQMKTASIGPITSKTMRKNHLPIDVEAAQYDVDGLIEAVLKLCAK